LRPAGEGGSPSAVGERQAAEIEPTPETRRLLAEARGSKVEVSTHSLERSEEKWPSEVRRETDVREGL
jgi:hypothetical protein